MTRDELIGLLQVHRVPLETWGTGEAKTADYLLREIESGEVTLEFQEGKLLRTCAGVGLNIHALVDGVPYLLVEKEQIFPDGRRRTRNLSTSLGEKLQPGESPESAAYRALKEELGIQSTASVLRHYLHGKRLEKKGPVPSDSYPGIWSMYTLTVFEFIMPIQHFVREGYRETRKDQTTVFAWREDWGPGTE